MGFPEHIFRSYDIRGLLEEVTPDLAQKIGAGVVRKTKAKCVVVGRDMRATSPELMAAAIQGITQAGADVLDIGMCTTCVFNFAVSSREDVDAGLMVTASHNPPQYNGIKMAYASGLPIPGKQMLELVSEPLTTAARIGGVASLDILGAYLDAAVSKADVPDISGTKIVVDYGNGMGVVSVRPLLQRLGVQAIELYPEPDARFPNHEANPAKEETLRDVKAAVVHEGADFAIALDGDADRVGFIDNEGVSIPGDLMLALLARDLLRREPGAKVVTSPNQSWMTTRTIVEHGGHVIECPIGRTFVIAAMHERHAALGGEVSSHFFYHDFACLESVDHTIARVLGIWKRSGKSFADLVRGLRRYANSGEVNVEVENKQMVLQRLEETYAPKATVVNKLDGIRCEFDDEWWFIVRPSNTEPLLRITVEATSEALMTQKRDELVKFVTVG
jgi:phosphomannomutase